MLYETSEYCSRDMLNFDFLEKGLGMVSPSHFSCYALLSDQTSLPDCFYFLRIWSICVLQGCDVINFEINLIFLINAFFDMTKSSIQPFKY